jgi:lysylphosphatidylglycerol synthetase-like protein (DUF2156 family)
MKDRIARRILSLILAAALILCAAPAAFAAVGITIEELREIFDSRVEMPKKSSLLVEPEKMIIKSRDGQMIYVLSGLRGGEKIFKAEDGATVIVYARESGYALAMVEGTSIGGWMNEQYLTPAEESKASGLETGEGEISLAGLRQIFDSRVVMPQRESLLEEPEWMVVTPKNGKLIYVLSALKGGKKIFEAAADSVVIVYAREKGYCLALVEGTSIGGWMNEKYLVAEEEVYGGAAVDAAGMEDLMSMFDSRVQKPKPSSVLEETETFFVQPKKGRAIYVLSGLRDAKKLFTAEQGATVIVYARESGYALAIVEGTTIGGWMNEQYLVPFD